ncbi:molybdenum ABC transporter ATP-binding protein [Marinilabilia rubra]|uniref:molybdenum ABC transporter ATP-binding protein n=1 Tax=Marinilabilia rubra TaxID=2162893 RepID=UPI001304BEA3|nr:molybdenum ABC transporter ATP-binding protein [Marinilabilia rubra]
MSGCLKINITLQRPGFSFRINETFKPGITGVFGQSGAGKTTLLQCISGGVHPENGYISSNGHTLFSKSDNVNVPSHKRRVGYVFQEGRLFPHFSVRQNLLYGTRFRKNNNTGNALERMTGMLNIDHLIDKYPGSLSGGERQRVALGRALLASPEILLLDEPFSALDQELRQQIIPYISKVAKHLNIPVLIVSHDLPDIIKLTSRLCLLSKGEVVAHDHYEALMHQQYLFNILPAADALNSITMEVKSVNPEDGMIVLNGFGEGRRVNVTFEPGVHNYTRGSKMKVFLRPDHIVLARGRVEGSSFRNQLEGRIVETFDEGPRLLCHVDCGFPLVAEVSRAAGRELELQKGTRVFCLFKTLALDAVQV